MIRNPKAQRTRQRPTEKRSWKPAWTTTLWPVTGNECHRITSAASANRKAFQRVGSRIEYLPQFRSRSPRVARSPSTPSYRRQRPGLACRPAAALRWWTVAAAKRHGTSGGRTVGSSESSEADFRLRRDFRDSAGFSTTNQLSAASGTVAAVAMPKNRTDSGWQVHRPPATAGRKCVNVSAVGHIRT